jgi:hypothetical protein
MSMYTQILDVALHERPQREAEMGTGEALSALLDCRQHLDLVASSEPGTDWSSAALANQISYDIALIDLARCFGLDCDPSSFDQPQRRRTEIEHTLIARGVRLEGFDHHRADSGSDGR